MKKPKNRLGRLREVIESGHWSNGIVPYAFHANFTDNGSMFTKNLYRTME